MTEFDRPDKNQAACLLAQIRDLARRHRSLVSRLSSAELLADGIALEISRIEEHLEAGTAAPRGMPKRREARGGAVAGERPAAGLRRVAEAGAASLEIRRRAEGACEVRVDEGSWFLLPPLLADLLMVLSLGGHACRDRLVGWKSLDEVASALEKRTGRKLGRHALTQNIYRLRRELFRRGGVNPFLVQTNRSRGARFALREKKARAAASD